MKSNSRPFTPTQNVVGHGWKNGEEYQCPAEMFGQCCVVEFVNSDYTIHAGWWAVGSTKITAIFAVFSDLQVARNFAAWVDRIFDLDGIVVRGISGELTEQDNEDMTYIGKRMCHACFVDIKVPPEALLFRAG